MEALFHISYLQLRRGMSFVIPRTLSFSYSGWLFQSFTVHNESIKLITMVVRRTEGFCSQTHFLLKQQTLKTIVSETSKSYVANFESITFCQRNP